MKSISKNLKTSSSFIWVQETKGLWPFFTAKNHGQLVTAHMSHEKRKRILSSILTGCLIFRAPYFMVYEIIPIITGVGFHPQQIP